jgi:hypothetical protein
MQRYGGWDPGHQVDNDFGAILIRCYRVSDGEPATVAIAEPLVSAAWHAVGADDGARRTIVHRARSDEFTIHLPWGMPPCGGQVKVWFIYGDFFGHPVPDSWPDEPELDGGTLAFFHVDWQLAADETIELSITQPTPEPTGFDWRQWVGRDAEDAKPIGEARLEAFLR